MQEVSVRVEGLRVRYPAAARDWLSHRFRHLVTESGLPPVRLHDLRHGAATLALTAGTDLRIVQDMLGHSSYAFTADTYTAVLPEVAFRAAEATARIVLTALSSSEGKAATTSPIAAPTAARQ